MTSKNIRNTHANPSASFKALFDKNVYLNFAQGIIPGDRCDIKSPKFIILFKQNLFFLRFNSGTPLLMEAMPVLLQVTS